MTDTELRYLMRKKMIESYDPGPINYKAMAWGHILINIGLAILVFMVLRCL